MTWYRSQTQEVASPLGNFFITTVYDSDNTAFEVIINHGKAGTREKADAQAMGFLISEALQAGVSMERITRKLRGISSEDAIGLGPQKVGSLPDAIAIALEREVRNE